MTKPVPPSQPDEELVEMEAMDLEEWEKDQHTPQAPDAKLAALVKQSAEVSPPVSVRHTQTQTVARVVKQPPPTPAGAPNQARFAPPAPLEPGELDPFDSPTTVNAGAALVPTRAAVPTTTRSMTATPAAATPSTTNRHTTTRSATPAGPMPRLQPTASQTGTPAGPTPRLKPTASQAATPAGPTPRLQPTASQAATPAGGIPTAATPAGGTATGAKTAAALRGLGTPSGAPPTAAPPKATSTAVGGAPTMAAPRKTTSTPAAGTPTPATSPPASVGRTLTQAIGRIERTPAAPEPAARATPPPAARSTATPVGGVPAASVHTAATPVGGAPIFSATFPATPAGDAKVVAARKSATPIGGVPVASAKMTQGIGAIDRSPAAPARATPLAGTRTATPAVDVPAVAVKMTQTIGAVERPPAPVAVPPKKLSEPVPGEESEGWSLPDDLDEVAAQERKAPPPAASAPESTASRALAMPTPAASPTPPALSPSRFAPEAAAAMPEPSASHAPPPVAPPLSTQHPSEPPVPVSSELFGEATAAGGAAFVPEPTPASEPSAPGMPQPAPTGPQPYVTQSSVQPHSQPMHVIQPPQPIVYPQAPPPDAPMAPAPMPTSMFDEQRRERRHETSDSFSVVGGAQKPWLLIGGVGVGAIALIVIIVMLMRGKDEPRVADKPSTPTPDRVEPTVKPPPDDVVAVVTPDASEPPPDASEPPPNTGANASTNPPDAVNAKPTGTPRTPKTPKIRGTKTVPIETRKDTTVPVTATGGDGDKGAKAQSAYKAGNQKLFAGDAAGAIVAYREVIAMGSSSGYRGLGLAYAQRGDTANAIAAFKKYLALSPKAADVAVIKKRLAALQGK